MDRAVSEDEESGWKPDRIPLNATPLVTLIVQRVMSKVSKLVEKIPASRLISVEKIVTSVVTPFVADRLMGYFSPYRIPDTELNQMTSSFYRFGKLVERVAATGQQTGVFPNPEMAAVKFEFDRWLWRAQKSSSDPPPRPSCYPCQMIRGWCAKRLARAVDDLRPLDLGLLASLQKGAKQAWPSVSQEFVVKTLEGHRDAMSRQPTKLDSDFEATLRKVAEEVFCLQRWRDHRIPFEPRKFLPTQSATLECSRQEGGGFSLCEPLIPLPLPNTEKEEVVVSTVGSSTWAKPSGFIRPGLLVEYHHALNDVRQRNFESLMHQHEESQERWLVYDAIHGVSREGGLRPVAIREPAKCRMVTCGNGALYGLLQPLQGYMLDCWKAVPNSTMTRDQDLTERVTSMLREMKSVLRRDGIGERMVPWGQHFDVDCDLRVVSGDYKSATDLQFADCTRCVVDVLETVPNIQGFYVRLARESFSPGELCYRGLLTKRESRELSEMTDDYVKHALASGRSLDDQFDHDLEVMELEFYHRHPHAHCVRTEGQPMGHPLSFPILCTTNRAVLSHAIKLWALQALAEDDDRRRASVTRDTRLYVGQKILSTCIVNGDDILFTCPEGLIQSFYRAAALAGFHISIGKNYVSKPGGFCLINSQFFRLYKDHAIRVGYLNQNLFEGSLKSQGSEGPAYHHGREVSELSPEGMCEPINRVIELYPPAISVLPRYMSRLKTLISRTCRWEPNWFLPVSLGGLGIRPEFGPRWRDAEGNATPYHATREQRLIAAQCYHDPDYAVWAKTGVIPARNELEWEKLPEKVRGRHKSFGEWLEATTASPDALKQQRCCRMQQKILRGAVQTAFKPLLQRGERLPPRWAGCLARDQSYEPEDPVLGRMMTVMRWCDLIAKDDSRKISILRPLRKGRLKPMSHAKLVEAASARWVYPVLSCLPQLPAIRMPVLDLYSL